MTNNIDKSESKLNETILLVCTVVSVFLTFISTITSCLSIRYVSTQLADERSRHEELKRESNRPILLFEKDYYSFQIGLPINQQGKDITEIIIPSSGNDSIVLHNYGIGSAIECDVTWEIYDQMSLERMGKDLHSKLVVSHLDSQDKTTLSTLPIELFKVSRTQGAVRLNSKDRAGISEKITYEFDSSNSEKNGKLEIRIQLKLRSNRRDFSKPWNWVSH